MVYMDFKSSMLLFEKNNEEIHVNQELVSQVSPDKRRNPPGIPNPDVTEIIALSPTTLLAKNRFFCEVCCKGFPREQNLQLHKRGHNMPWKLKHSITKENDDAKIKKVYVCPDASCVHHHPSHALGDRAGIKKHYYRKHCEKKYKCTKCTKMYGVQSDLKAHLKTCGNKKYQCHCGTFFSSHASFISHSASCDARAINSSLSEDTQNDHKYQIKSSDTRILTNLKNKNTIIQQDNYKELDNSRFMGGRRDRSNGNGEGSSLFSGKYDTVASGPQIVATASVNKAALLGSSSSSFTCNNLVKSATKATTGEGSNRKFLYGDISNSKANPFSSSGLNVKVPYEQRDSHGGGYDHNDEYHKWNTEKNHWPQIYTLRKMDFQQSRGVAVTRDFLGLGRSSM